MKDLSFIFNAHPSYIESMYTSYQQSPDNVEESWRLFFKGFDLALNSNGHADAGSTVVDSGNLAKELKVYAIIKAYRDIGVATGENQPQNVTYNYNAISRW